jgi:urease accessory protein
MTFIRKHREGRWRFDLMKEYFSQATALGRTASDEIFVGNRAIGRVALTVTAASDATHRQRVHEAGALRIRFPNVASRDTLEAVIVNTAGGMAGGDRFDVDISVGAGARLSVTTAAAEKAYRSIGPDTAINVTLAVNRGGLLAWLPQETILFDQARLRRTIEVDLACQASLILAEGVVFGRSAMGEKVIGGRFFDRWRVRLDDVLVFAESTSLDGAIAQKLAQHAVAGARVAIASVLKIPGDETAVAAVRAIEQKFVGEVGVSAWRGLAAARFVAPSGAALRHDLIGVLTAWCGTPLPRLWVN